jgi:hypothetical protein
MPEAIDYTIRRSGDPWSHDCGDRLHLDLRIGVVKGCL